MITNLFPEVLSIHRALQYLPKHLITDVPELVARVTPLYREILSYV
jgi:hypothetical protein